MEGNMILLLPMLCPIAAGIVVLAGKVFRKNRKYLTGLSVMVLVLEFALALWAVMSGGGLTMLRLTDQLSLGLHADGVSRLFAMLTASVWLLVGIYSVAYMSHEEEEHRFFGYYLIVVGVLMGLNFSANLITLYVFYELMTLTSLPLVLHERSKEAVRAGLKYLFYSVAGAFLALFGIFFLAGVSESLTFTAGGVLNDGALAGKEGVFLISAFCMILGFGAKAGMFPLHGWLPTAHPVAPACASAVLSGLITKAGVLAIIRVVYYVIGADRLRGTWVQNAWILLTLLHAGLQGAGDEKAPRLLYREPGELCPLRTEHAEPDCLCGSPLPCGLPLRDQERSVPDSGSRHRDYRLDQGGADERSGTSDAEDSGVLYCSGAGPHRNSACKRICQQMVSGLGSPLLGNGSVGLGRTGGFAGQRPSHRRLPAASDYPGILPGT